MFSNGWFTMITCVCINIITIMTIHTIEKENHKTTENQHYFLYWKAFCSKNKQVPVVKYTERHKLITIWIIAHTLKITVLYNTAWVPWLPAVTKCRGNEKKYKGYMYQRSGILFKDWNIHQNTFEIKTPLASFLLIQFSLLEYSNFNIYHAMHCGHLAKI